MDDHAHADRGPALTARMPALVAAVAILVTACAAPGAAPSPTASPSPQNAKAQILVFSPSSPNLTVIDGQTNEVVRTADVEIPGGGIWSYNDDNNYFDGTNLWLNTRNNNNAKDLEVIALNVDTLKVVGRIKVGSGDFNIFMGQAFKDGLLPIGTRDLGTIVTIDTKTMKLVNTFNVPIDQDPSGKLLYRSDEPVAGPTGSVVCDIGTYEGPDGIARVYYPTNKSELVIEINARTGDVLKVGKTAAGGHGNMLSTQPSTGKVWVQENDTNSQAVLDPLTLAVIARIPTGKTPSVNSFSPEGKLTYINGGDTVTTVADTQTYKVVASVVVGVNATQSAAHPNGKVVYMQVSKEAAIAVVDTSTWQVIKRIPLGTNPSGMFVRRLP
jgi:hypothetical protein